MEFRGKTFKPSERVLLDGGTFIDCTFGPGAILEYNGSDGAHFQSCRFHAAARWEFVHHAADVLDFLRFFSTVPGMRDVVRGWVEGDVARLD